MAIDKTTGLWTPQASGGGGVGSSEETEQLKAELQGVKAELQSVKTEISQAVTELGGI